jgi:hypothetical protein
MSKDFEIKFKIDEQIFEVFKYFFFHDTDSYFYEVSHREMT